jgi:hypothetical protein
LSSVEEIRCEKGTENTRKALNTVGFVCLGFKIFSSVGPFQTV